MTVRTVGNTLLILVSIACSFVLLYVGRTAHTTRDAFALTVEELAQRDHDRAKVPAWATPLSRDELIATGLRALLTNILAIDRVQITPSDTGVTIDVIARTGERVRIYATAAGVVYRIESVS